ncbi:MAG: hypothetical protein J0I99_00770 [Devosia sp.]|uniref:hypothetical protein n=1 Tax=Devosia sp. TaxID=1871048 RepID=UPI001AC12EA7|nr:hypothetical protein [Devosia sp.]MBN9308797.1 hypothetical protein [Devosia sp.]MBN9314250.1 hypothetical protein [Devosia sp.]
MTEQRYAVLNGNTVIDAVLWDPERYPNYAYPWEHTALVPHATAMPGWTRNGNVWTPPAPEEPDPGLEPKVNDIYPPLEKWRFWTVVRSPGSIGEANLRGAIEAHPDGNFKALALSILDDPPGGLYMRSNPLFADATLLGTLGLTEAAVNAMWNSAHALTLPGS